MIDEKALLAGLESGHIGGAAIDVFPVEPKSNKESFESPLRRFDNVILTPHIASATTWTREGMATLAAANVAAILQGYPLWQGDDVLPFLEGDLPSYAPSIVNASELDLT